MKTIKQSILIIVIGLALASGISFAAGTWSDPTANPTGGNTDAPINTGSSPQAKSAGLALGIGDKTYAPENGLYVQGGSFFQGSAWFNTNANVVGTLTTNGLYVQGSAWFNNSAGFVGDVSIGEKTKTETLQVTDDAEKGKVLISSDSSGNASWGTFPLPGYDSGWVSLEGQKGELFQLPASHNLGSLDTIVYIEGMDKNGLIHQANFGSDSGAGLKLYSKTTKDVVVKRAAEDTCSDDYQCWNSVRVLMWRWK